MDSAEKDKPNVEPTAVVMDLEEEEKKHLNNIAGSVSQVLNPNSNSQSISASGINTGIPIIEVIPPVNESPVKDPSVIRWAVHQVDLEEPDMDRRVGDSEFEDLMFGLQHKPRTSESPKFLNVLMEKLKKINPGAEIELKDRKN